MGFDPNFNKPLINLPGPRFDRPLINLPSPIFIFPLINIPVPIFGFPLINVPTPIANEPLINVPINTGQMCVLKKNDDNQEAVIDLAQEAKQRGITPENTQTLIGWANEYGVIPVHEPTSHPNRNFKDPHIRIGPVNHIPIKQK
jgi:hypothetical protein